MGRFLLVVVAASAVALAPWPRWGRCFAAAFGSYASFVVHALAIGDASDLRFATPTQAERLRPDVGEWTVLLFGDGDPGTSLDTRILGYTPLAVFAALVVATRVAPRRKLTILVGGGTLMLARLAAAIALPVARSLGDRGPSWAQGATAEVVWWTFITPPAMSYAAAAFSWWVVLALTTPRRRRVDLRTPEGPKGSARTRASKRDRGTISTGG